MSFGCSFELTRRGKIKPVMELNTVNLELDFKVFSFSFILNNWGLLWWHTALSYKCKASQGNREEL